MDHLWSPWRYQYVSSAGIVPLGKDYCFFCQIAADAAEDAVNLVVLRAERSFVLLNRYPYCSGHLMIAPYAHVASLAETEVATLEEMMRLAQRCETALRRVYGPDGLNFGFNIGQAAGAGVAGHIHMHGLPRWTGDTQFHDDYRRNPCSAGRSGVYSRKTGGGPRRFKSSRSKSG